MAVNVQEQPHRATGLLDLPNEMITYICTDNALTPTDIYNLAKSHSKLNNWLFHEQNSSLWKAKYKQKYDDSNINEFQIAIDHHNCWRTEMMLRMNLNKSVPREIMQMPSKYLKFKNIPYHSYPFGEELNSNNQNCQYYVYRSSLEFYKHMSSPCHKKNQHVLYMALQFLKYTSKVFFGYKIQDFLSLPPAEQTIERGFHLLGRWWCPTDDLSYNDLRGNLDAITLVLYDLLYTEQNQHSMFKNGYDFDSVIQNGKSNLDHDLYNEKESKIILNCISEIIMKDDFMVCPCHHKANCFLLQKALVDSIGSVFILCLLYESIARRLGVKVGIISTLAHTYVSWTSSWPGNSNMNNTAFSIIIPNNRNVQTIIRPDNLNLAKTSISDLLWTYSKFIEYHAFNYEDTYRNAVNFQTLLKPEDTVVQSRSQTFPEGYEFCPCPLFRTPLNPLAPKHMDEKLNMYARSEDIFPLTPRRRGTNTDPKFSIGMLVWTPKYCAERRVIIFTYGIIVSWSPILNTSRHLYYLLMYPEQRNTSTAEYLTPIIERAIDSEIAEIFVDATMFDYTFMNLGKYFKYYDPELYSFVPIDDLAELYPDDLANTVNFMKEIKNVYNNIPTENIVLP